jgi:hypothetical protein
MRKRRKKEKNYNFQHDGSVPERYVHLKIIYNYIEAFGAPHRLGPVAASSNENKYNYSSIDVR